MSIDYLDPRTPVAITEPAKTYTAVAVDMDFAHVRARHDRTDYRVAAEHAAKTPRRDARTGRFVARGRG